MVVVAIAGGTGNVGRTIAEAIVALGKHEVLILSRKENPELSAKLGLPILAVNYGDVDGLTKTLEKYHVHTVISTLFMMPSPTGEIPKEIELIQAADNSSITKRIISSDWGLPHTPDQVLQLPSVGIKLDAQKALELVTDLEYTRFYNGFFLDYYGTPKVKSYMTKTVMVLDIANNAAAIPGSGDTPVVFTHTTDVAKFVAASLDLDKWDPASYVIGDRVTWNEFLYLAEEVKGAKFAVAYDSVEKLAKGEVTELPGQVAAYQFFPKAAYQMFASIFGLWFEEGRHNFQPKITLNDRFSHIQTLKVKEFLEKAWK